MTVPKGMDNRQASEEFLSPDLRKIASRELVPTANVVLLVLRRWAVGPVVAEHGGGVHAGHALAVCADVELVGVRPAGG